MIHFCTYFDIKYIHKGIALYQSLVREKQPFTLWVLCFDEATYCALETLRLPNIELIAQSDFERDDEALLSTKATRSRVEYYWTCTPSLPIYVFRQRPDVSRLVYLDADTFIFSSPTAILDELGEGSVLIVPHDYAEGYQEHWPSGVYNVGIMAFRRDAKGMDCLNWWRARCIEWCYWKHEDGKIGDQAYLNDWPERFENVVVSGHAGINAAPWNVQKYGVTADDAGGFYVGGKPLVCFHFHGCQICTSRLALIAGFKVALPTSMLRLVYRPYIEQLVRAQQLLSGHGIHVEIPMSGFPWRYVLGRIVKRQPLKHFMWIRRRRSASHDHAASL